MIQDYVEVEFFFVASYFHAAFHYIGMPDEDAFIGPLPCYA